ncbi:hypothetical protein JSE7799_01361 [Jannaschia seosinensis]|uniref:Uncharacterized protein n=1 Tax=Jannaschia seosinensis TaxID=313367 RepID=A0A0M7BA03_9RHOB|nr:hypothetical protein [Jannaschia seosinensis]CUH38066.1 hypothetical protein JSE7799_01361 [Jannaschia seosinensis]
MIRTVTALATAATLSFSGMAFAEAHMSASSMNEGYNMLQTALMSDFDRLGIPTDTMDDLTLGQIAAIKSILESDDDENQTKVQIEAIIANN